jgi:formate--tetrahydrofolate ligase
VRALKFHCGRFDVRPGRPLPDALLREDLDTLQCGFANLEGHLANLRRYGIPIVVAINQFPSDTKAKLDLIKTLALESGAKRIAHTAAFSRGGEGSLELADAVIDACSDVNPERGFQHLYALDLPYQQKIERIAMQTYGADGIELHDGVADQLNEFARQGYGHLPVCIAKTQYSLSHESKRPGRPTGFRLPIREVRLAAGAGFVLVLTDGISLMPGLPREPAALRIDVDAAGGIVGLGPADI